MKRSHQAVVIGGGMAGLLVARVLSDHFEQVTIIERDLFPEGIKTRKGVPQDAHVHALLAGGEKVLSRLFPGLDSELIQGGAEAVDLAGDVRWFQFGQYKLQYASGFRGLSQSRPFLEWHIRRRVLTLKNVVCLTGCEARELVPTKDRSRITGVKVRRRDSEEDERFDASLVVDATGRGSPSPRWLEQLGYARPRESVIKVGIRYATCTYRRKPADLPGAKILLVFPTPPCETRTGAVVPIEEYRWMVSLCAWCGHQTPTDQSGFLEFARSLPIPDIYELLTRIEPVTEITSHRFPSNLRRHYEDMSRFPEGYVIVGDALCSFNPVYGQGMTASAFEVEVLDQCLRRQQRTGAELTGFPRRFFRQVSHVVDRPWQLAANSDLQYSGVEGKKTVGTGVMNRYIARLHRVITYDQAVYGELIKVMNLMQPATTLFHPRVLLRVLRGNLMGRRMLVRPPRE